MKKYILLFVFIGLFSNSYSQWEITSDIYYNYGFSDIRFLNNDTGFFVGDKSNISGQLIGVIGKTTNGGISWDSIEYSDTKFLGINFLNDDTGFVCGFQKILKTVDGGINWSSIDLTQSGITNLGYVYSFWFLTNQHGFATSFYGLLETFDCGETWAYVQTSIGDDIWGNSITFKSDSIGYVGGAFKTIDGGGNWEYIGSGQSIPTLYVNNYSFSPDESYFNYYNDSLGFIIGYTPAGPGASAGIYKTIDGGNNWDFTSIPYMGTLNAIEFVDKDIIHAAGNTGFNLQLPIPNPFFSFIKTIDGGNSWYYQESELDTVGFIITALEFTDDKTGYATAIYWNANYEPHSVILKTTDGGGTLFPIPGMSYSIEENISKDIKIYPNPANNTLNINIPNGVQSISIYNQTGQLVLSKKLEFAETLHSIDISNLPVGSYFIRLVGKENVWAEKFVVIR